MQRHRDGRDRGWWLAACGLLAAVCTAPAEPASQEHDVPNRREQLAQLARDHLLGEFGACDWMHGRLLPGLTVDLTYTNEVFGNLSGGLRTRRATVCRGDASAFLHLDTAAAGWWSGGHLHVQYQHLHGHGLGPWFVGDNQLTSNLDARPLSHFAELWYRHQTKDGRLWIRGGLLEANNDFAVVEQGLEFINSSAGVSPTVPLVTFPDTNWGVVLGTAPTDRVSVNLGVYDSRPQGGPMVLLEPAWHFGGARCPGHLRLGGWWNGNHFAAVDPNSARRYHGAQGLYASWDQRVWAPHGAAADSPRGLGAFVQYGYTPGDRSLVEHYGGAGVAWTGWLPERPSDVVGLGVFQARFSREAGLRFRAETEVEWFYKLAVAPWLSAKFDLQYVGQPGGLARDAVVAGVRVTTSF